MVRRSRGDCKAVNTVEWRGKIAAVVDPPTKENAAAKASIQESTAAGSPSSMDEVEAADERFMRLALAEADRAASLGDVPVGAVIVRDGKVIARGYNRREVDQDPMAHAEIQAIRAASEVVGSWRLVDCTLYVTLEPCAMCAGALVNSRVDTLVFAANDPKAGYCGSLGDVVRDSRLNHRLTVRRGIMQSQSSRRLRDFFAALRARREEEADGRSLKRRFDGKSAHER